MSKIIPSLQLLGCRCIDASALTAAQPRHGSLQLAATDRNQPRHLSLQLLRLSVCSASFLAIIMLRPRFGICTWQYSHSLLFWRTVYALEEAINPGLKRTS
jgi:hypothetical protein